MTDTTDKEEETVLLSDPSTGTIARASSILQRNTKLYGPMNALNTNDSSSCWNSDACQDEHEQQYLILDFSRNVRVSKLKIEFQAGFIGETCIVKLKKGEDWIDLQELEPEDNHDVQTFSLLGETTTGSALKLVFEDFTDFYGRVTIYRIEVWGQEVSL